MSAFRFAPAVALVLSYEGGFSDDAHDPGGATCYGVTLATLSEWRGRPCTVSEVRNLSRADVQPIYKARYWDAIRGDDLPAGPDLIAFDGAVNQGVGAISRMLQRAVGAAVDGQLGPATLKALDAYAPSDLIERLRAERASAYRGDRGFGRYGVGWLRRLQGVSHTAQSWAAKTAT